MEDCCSRCGYPETEELGQLVKQNVNGISGKWHFPCLREQKREDELRSVNKSQ